MKDKGIVIAVYNNKGGVGKSTFCINFAHALQMNFNKKVLVIDNDGQSNVTYTLTRKTEDEITDLNIKTIFDMMVDEDTTAKDCVMKSILSDDIDVIPATDDHADTPDAIASYMDNTRIMDEKLRSVKDAYDYIIIDCAPTRDRNIYNALFAADIVLTPVETQIFSRIGLRNLLKQVNKINKRKEKPLLHYVFLSRVDNRQRVHNQKVRNNLENLLFDDFIKSDISLLSLYSKSFEQGYTALTYPGDNKGNLEISKLTNIIVNKIKEELI